MTVKVKVLNGAKKGATTKQTTLPNSRKKKKVLTSAYVRELNQGISYRIQQREHSHADSVDLAAKARFR